MVPCLLQQSTIWYTWGPASPCQTSRTHAGPAVKQPAIAGLPVDHDEGCEQHRCWARAGPCCARAGGVLRVLGMLGRAGRGRNQSGGGFADTGRRGGGGGLDGPAAVRFALPRRHFRRGPAAGVCTPACVGVCGGPVRPPSAVHHCSGWGPCACGLSLSLSLWALGFLARRPAHKGGAAEARVRQGQPWVLGVIHVSAVSVSGWVMSVVSHRKPLRLKQSPTTVVAISGRWCDSQPSTRSGMA